MPNKKKTRFEIIGLTPPLLGDPAIAIAADRAGAIGMLNCEYTTDFATMTHAVEKLSQHISKACGVKITLDLTNELETFIAGLPDNVFYVYVASLFGASYRSAIEIIHAHHKKAWCEATAHADAVRAVHDGADAVVLKGSENGGVVGDETTFVLLQRAVQCIGIPVYVYGGAGLHGFAACCIAGAAGVVLETPWYAMKESSLPETAKQAILTADSAQTRCLGAGGTPSFRVYNSPRCDCIKQLQSLVEESSAGEPTGDPSSHWLRQVIGKLGWNPGAGEIMPLGQDLNTARQFARSYITVGRAVQQILQSVSGNCMSVKQRNPFARNNPLACDHRTVFPIVQGPMTRVSDTPDFARAVADAGALPSIAAGVLKKEELEPLLNDASRLLSDVPWAVGLLGFIDNELWNAQIECVCRSHPSCAIIAGGRPDQARFLEEHGISTYLHVPSTRLLPQFIAEGCRRFIFEGRECGGHIGPLGGFALWEEAVDVFMNGIDRKTAGQCSVLFAGGIHDACSAAMVSAFAAPLADIGVRVGMLAATGYLFTREAVSAGAIGEQYQKELIDCSATAVLTSGTGHEVRCVPTPYVAYFGRVKRELRQSAHRAEAVRETLDALNIGRLRLAAKGLRRAEGAAGGRTELLESVGDEIRHEEGIFMTGQIASLHDHIFTIQEFHSALVPGCENHIESIGLPGPSEQPKGPCRTSCDIAIVGMSCILPKAPDVETFWRNILNKTNAITDIPASRWSWQEYFDINPEAQDKSYSRWGGFIDPVPFDPVEFGMPPNSLKSIEPVQLLSLLAARDALRDAGYDKENHLRETTSVIIGVSGGLGDLGQRYVVRSTLPSVTGCELPHELRNRLPEWTEDTFAGLLLNVIAGRIANRFNLGGVCYGVDAACASSLAAVYQAVNELAAGRCDMVITGGADTLQNPFSFMCFSKTHALSSTGAVRTFDQSADGTCISEGISLMVLKRLQDAQRDGDRIYAVIKGIGGSSDGRARGLTAPSPEGQYRALKRAYEYADVDLATIGLIEAHGTGTEAGDRAEIESLNRLFGGRNRNGSVALGSVKSFIGHTKAAAGSTGILKLALALYHKVLPPTGGITSPNQSLAESALYPNTDTRPWIAPRRRAGVSAFGFGGVNFHAIMEEYSGHDAAEPALLKDHPGELCLLCGSTKSDLMRQASVLAELLSSGAEHPLRDIAYSFSRTFNSGALFRLAIVATSHNDLKEKIDRVEKTLPLVTVITDAEGIYYTEKPLGAPGALAMLFPGQGAQSVNMLKDLCCFYPEMRQVFEQADALLSPAYEAPLSSYIYPIPVFAKQEADAQAEVLARTHITQPCLGAAEYGVLRLLASFGVRPGAVAGHSYGELVALAAAGAFDEATLLRLSETRGRLMQEAAATGAGGGGMIAVMAGVDRVEKVIWGKDGLWTANINAPEQTVLSGTLVALDRAEKLFGDQGIETRRLPVSCGFHSPLVAQAQSAFREYLAGVQIDKPAIPVFSNTTAGPMGGDADAIRDTLGRQLTSPVRFVEEIRALYDAGARIFIECGPRNILSNLAGRILDGRDCCILPVDKKGRHGVLQLYSVLGQLASHGISLATDRLFAGRHVHDVFAPTSSLSPRMSSTAWMVDAGNCRPCHVPKTQKPPISLRTTPSTEKLYLQEQPMETHNQSPMPATVTPESGAVKSTADPLIACINSHQALMQQFLKTQEYVMQAFINYPGVGLHADPWQTLLSPQTIQDMTASPGVLPPLGATAQQNQELTKQPPEAMPHADVSIRQQADAAQMQAADTGNTVTDSEIATALLSIVSERTGYPVNMLDTTIDIEAELGIDSIKRVEIVGALKQRYPELLKDGAHQQLSKLKTLGEMTSFLVAQPQPSSSVLSPTRPTSPVGSTDSADCSHAVLSVVSERTGYPTELLDITVDIEAELGIDSIKRVEIIGALRQRYPALTANVQSKDLARFKTLQDIIRSLQGALLAADAPTAGPALPGNNESPEKNSKKKRPARCLHSLTVQPLDKQQPMFDISGVFLITEDTRGIAHMLQEKIVLLGGSALVLRSGHDYKRIDKNVYQIDYRSDEAAAASIDAMMKESGKPVCGILHMASSGRKKQRYSGTFKQWDENTTVGVKDLFLLVKNLHNRLRSSTAGHKTLVCAITDIGALYSPGQVTEAGLFPEIGGVAGLVNTIATELEAVVCKCIHFKEHYHPVRQVDWILDELVADDGSRQIVYQDAVRHVVDIKETPFIPQESPGNPINEKSVILITGGARGITARVAVYLAQAFRPTLILMGRTPEPPVQEPENIRSVFGAASLKAVIRENQIKEHGKASLRDIEDAYRLLCAQREIRATLSAIREAGGHAVYYPVDVTDARSLQSAIQDIYSRFTVITGVIHGAGIIEDKLIADKTLVSFNRVFNTKAHSTFTLMNSLEPSTISFCLFFSSVSTLGSRGQCDYSAANELLSTVAKYYNHVWPGRIAAIHWGPWEGSGMATDTIRKQLEERNVESINVDAGCEALVNELAYGHKYDARVIIGNGPWAPSVVRNLLRSAPDMPLLDDVSINGSSDGAFCARKILDCARDRYLLDHKLDGRPVFPVVFACELMVGMVQKMRPQKTPVEIQEFQMTNGIILADTSKSILVTAAKNHGAAERYTVEIRDERMPNCVYSKAVVELSDALPTAPRFDPSRFSGMPPFPYSVAETYEKLLFHGALLNGIQSITGSSESGMAGILRSTTPGECIAGCTCDSWLIGPVILDAGLQLLMAWHRHYFDMTMLPMRFERFVRYKPFLSGPVLCFLDAEGLHEGALLRSTLYFTDTNMNLYSVMHSVECSCTRELNRLTQKQVK